MKRHFPTLRVLILVTLLGPVATQAAPVTGIIDFGRTGLVVGAEDDDFVFLSEERFFPADVTNPAGPVVRFFGKVLADVEDGVIKGEQDMRRPFIRGDQSEVTGRLSPLLTIEPKPGVPPGTIQIPLDLVVTGQFEIPSFLFGPTGSARNTFDATLRMRNVSSNSGTLVSARYMYEWAAANSASGVTESFSHTPTTFVTPFAPPGLFNASVTPDDPRNAEFRTGFKDIRLHIDFPYSAGSGTLIELTSSIVSASGAFDGAAHGEWFNSAVLDLRLPDGYFVADENGNALAFNWDGIDSSAAAAAVPEPGTWLLFATGGTVLFALDWRRRRRAA